MNNQSSTFVTECLKHPLYAQKFQIKEYHIGQVLRCAGEEIQHFGLVLQGILKAECYTKQGYEVCCTYFEEHDTFPELLYFTGKRQFIYTLVAAKKAKVAWISVHDMEQILQKDRRLRDSFMNYVFQRGLNNQMLLTCLTYTTIEQRIAYWLLNIKNIKENESIQLPKSQKIWADTLHVSRSSLNHEIREMERKGYFCIEKKMLKLLDRTGLENIL